MKLHAKTLDVIPFITEAHCRALYIRPRLFASAMYLSNEMQDEGLQCKRYNYLYAVTM